MQVQIAVIQTTGCSWKYNPLQKFWFAEMHWIFCYKT